MRLQQLFMVGCLALLAAGCTNPSPVKGPPESPPKRLVNPPEKTPQKEPLPPPRAPSRIQLRDKRFLELSGVAHSRRRPHCFWLHNDSGHPAEIYGLDEQGQVLGTVLLKDISAFDWEDCAIGPGPDGKPHFWVGDIGNNLRLPLVKVLYRFPEPDPRALGGRILKIEKKDLQVFRFRFPELHLDCECLMVHPRTGLPYLVPKSNSSEVGLYTCPGELPKNLKPQTLIKVATLLVSGRPGYDRMITAGDFFPQGDRFLLRSYGALHIFPLPSRDKGGAVPRVKPLHTQRSPRQAGGDGVALDPKTGTAWLVGEGENSIIIKVPLPRK